MHEREEIVKSYGHKHFTPFVKKFAWWPVQTSDGVAWLKRVYTRTARTHFGDEHFPVTPLYYTDEEVTVAKLEGRL